MYNRNINKLSAIIQSPIAPRSTNVLWDDLVSNTLKVYRKGIWTVIGGAGGGGEGSSLYWGYDATQGVIFPLDNRSVQINGDLTVNGDITARKLSVAELEIDGEPFASYWELDSNTNTLSTTYQVLIKNSLVVEQDTSSGGEGQDTPGGSGGVSEEDVLNILEKNNYITSAALSSYYTKSQSDARYLALSGGILYNDVSDTPLYIKSNEGAAYIGFKNSSDAFLGYYGFNDTTPTVYIGTSAEYNIIHSGNIGSYNTGGFNVVDIRGVNPTPYNSGIEHAVTAWFNKGADTPNKSSYYGGISVKGWTNDYRVWQLASSSTSYLDSDKDLWFRTGVNDTWQPWRRIVSEDDNGNVTIGGSDLAGTSAKLSVDGSFTMWGAYQNMMPTLGDFTNARFKLYGYGNRTTQNWGLFAAAMNSGQAYLQVGGDFGDTLAYSLLLNPLGGNVLIGTTTDTGYKLDVAGSIKATLPIFGYMYGTNNNAAAFIFDKPGLNYTGIGSDGVSDTIRLGACNADGTWVDSYAQKWKFYGDVKADKYRLNENDNSFIGTQVGFLSLNSMGNEICIGTNLDDVHINYRLSADGTAPKTYYWRAGSATSWADFYVGTLLAMHQVETYGLYLRDADTTYTQRNMFGLYMWDNVVQFTRRDLNNAYQKALLELNLNNDNAYIYGNLIVSGDTSSGSDIRFKDVIKNKTLKIEHIAKAPLFTFKWNDRDDDSIHLGSSAQYWENIAPWLVSGSDFKSLNYATLGVAMGISLAKKAVNHEERIKVLEKEIKRLKEEMIHG